jgi:hypothetical protein
MAVAKLKNRDSKLTCQDEKNTGCWSLVSKVGMRMDVSAQSRSGSLSKYWFSNRCNPRGLYLGPDLNVDPNKPPLCAHDTQINTHCNRCWKKNNRASSN